MEEYILANLDEPGQLEKLYRANKEEFRKAFGTIYPRLQGKPIADFWKERLSYENDTIKWGTTKEFSLIIVLSLFAGIIAKLPAFLSVSENFFYPRNIGFIIFPTLYAYFAWKNKLSKAKTTIIVAASFTGLIFINLLPHAEDSDTLILSCLHLLLFLWFILGFAFTGEKLNKTGKRLEFLKYNGDLVVMSALLLISGGILTGITLGLFSVTGLDIEEFFFENIVVFALPAVPLFGTYLIQTNPQLVGKVSPVIARIFSPLALVMLVIYLVAMMYSGKDPYTDREFLLIFNLLLITVMALIFFSVSDTSGTIKRKSEIWVLFLLSIMTVVVNGIALSAILFRISEWGITPNRTAVLGANILILIHLLLVAPQLYKLLSGKISIDKVEKALASYLPVYFLWAIVVTFVFPLIFGIR